MGPRCTLLLIGVCCSALLMVRCASPISPGKDDRRAQLDFCVDEVNRLRASAGRAALQQSADLEAFADRAAEHDALARTAHGYFLMTNGSGVALAETQILWWKDEPVRTVIRKGLAQMWAVGPGGEHYDILAGPYREIGCGVFVSGTEVTVVQDFR